MNLHDQTKIRANNNPRFYARFKWLALGALAFGAYCVYDGAIGYPAMRVQGLAFLGLAEDALTDAEREELELVAPGEKARYAMALKAYEDSTELADAWKTLAAKNEWPADPPEKLKGDPEIVTQYVMAAVCGLAAAYFIGVVLSTRGRWIELDGDRLTTSGGVSFTTDTITQIEKQKWIDKGLAYVRYNDGKPRKFTVDDYKFQREETDAILYRIEQQAGLDKVVDGPPETLPEDEPAAQPAAGATDASAE